MIKSPDDKYGIIVGNVGTHAASNLEQTITRQTNVHTDQEVIPRIFFQYPIPDRTAFLLDEEKENPAEAVFKMVKAMVHAYRTFLEKEDIRCVVAVPCVTFHADKIFVPFMDKIGEEFGDRIEIINIIDRMIADTKKIAPGIEKVGILSTIGTKEAGTFRDKIEDAHLTPVELSGDLLKAVHQVIYKIKDLGYASHAMRGVLQDAADYLMLPEKGGAQLLEFSCTELPLAYPESPIFMYKTNYRYIDPIRAQARKFIKIIDPNKIVEFDNSFGERKETPNGQ